jgi:hypothetical protein
VRTSRLSVDRQGDLSTSRFALGHQSDGAVRITPEHGIRDPNILIQTVPPQGAAAHPQVYISQLLRRCTRQSRIKINGKRMCRAVQKLQNYVALTAVATSSAFSMELLPRSDECVFMFFDETNNPCNLMTGQAVVSS